MRKPSIHLALATLIATFSGCVSMESVSPLASLEKSLIYQGAKFPEGEWQPPDLKFVDAWFEAEDGTKLHGWYVPHESARAVALLMHGNAGNVTHRSETLKLLNERHSLSVMSFDYRGYGRSEGRSSEKGVLQDARAARTWLANATGVRESEIVLMGRSLGGGVAVDLAASDGARGLVLASTFTSLPEVSGHHFRLLPAKLLMTQRLDSLAKISSYHGPLLQTHGDSDQVIPYELGRKLFDAAPGPKQFITVEGGGHNSVQPEEYRVALDEFLDSLPPLQ